jgi:hypothetical protein
LNARELVIALTGLVFLSHSAAAQTMRFVTERHVFVRGEKATLQVGADPGVDGIRIDIAGRFPQVVRPHTVNARGAVKQQANYSFDTSLLRSGDYEVRAQAMRGATTLGAPVTFTLTIAPPPNPDRFPVWNWTMVSPKDLHWWKARGFTGVRPAAMHSPVDRTSETGKTFAALLEEGARLGVNVGVYLHPTEGVNTRRAAAAPVGTTVPKAYPRDPEVTEYALQTVTSVMQAFSDYPAFKQALVSSEYQVPYGDSKLWSHFAQQEAGLGPNEILPYEWTASSSKNVTILPEKIPGHLQPKDGIIEDTNQVYRFLNWWWLRGHGTNLLNAEVAKVVKASRPDILTWHDPYRLAATRASHTGLDMISTWTYGHPDILHHNYIRAMQAAARHERQKVMQTVTLYTYGHFVVPIGNSSADIENDRPGQDPSFTEGPDYTKEAIWLSLSQRPDVMGFYYASARNPLNTTRDPYFDSPETFDAIGEVSRTLIEPYGPTVLKSRRERPRVAILNSAVATWFHNGTPYAGYRTEAFLPYATLLTLNHVPFDVLLDEDIIEGKLNDYDVLILARGDTLLRSMHQRISEFARSGKKVIADRSLRSTIPGSKKLDFDFSFIPQVSGIPLAKGSGVTVEEYNARMETFADQLKPLIEGFQGVATADSKKVVVNTLQSGEVQYIFAINNLKTYGPRFGKWKLRQELGIRQEANLQVTNAASKAVYDAIARREQAVTTQNGNASFEVALPAAQGKLIAVLPEKIGKVEVTLPPTVERGKKAELRVRVFGVSGRPIVGAVPLQIQVDDDLGRATEYTRFVATAVDGSGYSHSIMPALNDQSGRWHVRVTELLSGQQSEQFLSIQ